MTESVDDNDLSSPGKFRYVNSNCQQHSDPATEEKIDHGVKHSKIRFLNPNEQSRSVGAIKLARGVTTNDALHQELSYDERRGSLQIMRQFKSMPVTGTHNLSSIISTKVTLPTISQDIDMLKRLRETDWMEFFVEIISGILAELDWRYVVKRIQINGCLLTYSEGCALYVNNVLYLDQSCYSGVKSFLTETAKQCSKSQSILLYKEKDLPLPVLEGGIINLWSLPIVHSEGKCRDNSAVTGTILLINFRYEHNIHKYIQQFIKCCARALNNSEMLNTYSSEFARNKALLESIHELYEEQNFLDGFIRKSLHQMKELIKCEQVAVFLFDQDDQICKQFKFSFGLNKSDKFFNCAENIGSRRIAMMTCKNGETFKYRKDESLEELNSLNINTMLCKPIFDSTNNIIGAIQAMNKGNSNFTKNDEDILEAIIIFCSVGICNCRLYENMTKSNARAQVALEALSYHTSASSGEIETLMQLENLPSFEEHHLSTHQFDDFSLSNDDMLIATIKMFKDTDLMTTFSINYETLCKWTLTVMKNYRNIAYHNWGHAFNVFHTMYYILCTVGVRRYLSDMETLGLMIGCLCHDLDHRGTNNTFQTKTDSALAQLYGNQATLEHHHFNFTVMIINSDGNNIFQSLTTEQYSTMMDIIRGSILATDLSRHFKNKDAYFLKIESNVNDWSSSEMRDLLRDILMTACDLSAATKKWTVARKAASLIMEEFFQQGDVEKSIYNLEPQYMMDRSKEDELPMMQIQWIEGVCEPLYKHLALIDSNLREMYKELIKNCNQWKKLSIECTTHSVGLQ